MYNRDVDLNNLCVIAVGSEWCEHLVGFDIPSGTSFKVEPLPFYIADKNRGKYFVHGGMITGVDFNGETYITVYSNHIEELLKGLGFSAAEELPVPLGNYPNPMIMGRKYPRKKDINMGYEGPTFHDKRLKALEDHPAGSYAGMFWNNLKLVAFLEDALGLPLPKKFYEEQVERARRGTDPDVPFYLSSIEAYEELMEMAENVKGLDPKGMVTTSALSRYKLDTMPKTTTRNRETVNIIDVVNEEQCGKKPAQPGDN